MYRRRFPDHPNHREHKDAGCVENFARVTFRREDKVLIEMQLSEIKPQEKLDDSGFDKPKSGR